MDDHAARLTIDLAALTANWRLLDRCSGPAETSAWSRPMPMGWASRPPCRLWPGRLPDLFRCPSLRGYPRPRGGAGGDDLYPQRVRGRANGRLPRPPVAPVLGSAPEIEAWQARPAAAEPAALHVDTAMNRLGIRLEAAMAMVAENRLGDLGIGLTMTHFASAEEPEAADTRAQIARFSALQAVIQAEGSHNQAIRPVCSIPRAISFPMSRSSS